MGVTPAEMIERARAMRRAGIERYRHLDGCELQLTPPKLRKKKYPRPEMEVEAKASDAIPADQRETRALADFVFGGDVPPDIAAAIKRASHGET